MTVFNCISTHFICSSTHHSTSINPCAWYVTVVIIDGMLSSSLKRSVLNFVTWYRLWKPPVLYLVAVRDLSRKKCRAWVTLALAVTFRVQQTWSPWLADVFYVLTRHERRKGEERPPKNMRGAGHLLILTDSWWSFVCICNQFPQNSSDAELNANDWVKDENFWLDKRKGTSDRGDQNASCRECHSDKISQLHITLLYQIPQVFAWF